MKSCPTSWKLAFRGYALRKNKRSTFGRLRFQLFANIWYCIRLYVYIVLFVTRPLYAFKYFNIILIANAGINTASNNNKFSVSRLFYWYFLITMMARTLTRREKILCFVGVLRSFISFYVSWPLKLIRFFIVTPVMYGNKK